MLSPRIFTSPPVGEDEGGGDERRERTGMRITAKFRRAGHRPRLSFPLLDKERAG
jgi:hypothetical protein